jgi:ABC-type transport system involved in multi-copper enzyme maturation permease subunit
MRNFIKCTGFTIADLVHHKSFYVMLTIGVLFVVLLRGCYKQDYTVNGQHVDATTVAWHASLIAFHVIAAAALFIALLLSLGTFKRDRDDGGMAYILSGPVARSQYVFAKIAGQWAVSFLFMFVLHATIVIITIFNTGGVIPGYLLASLVCSLNILFMVVMVNLFSLILPVFATALISLTVVAVSLASDSFFQLIQKTGLSVSFSDASLWRIVWPKTASLQFYATTLIDHSDFHAMGPLHPLINIVLWTIVLGGILVWKFRREDI